MYNHLKKALFLLACITAFSIIYYIISVTRNSPMEIHKKILNSVDFKSGIITYESLYIDPLIPVEEQAIGNLDEDLLQVEYPDNYILDMGWLHGINGRFVVTVAKDCDWENPISIKQTRSFIRLEKCVQDSVDLIMRLINNEKTVSDETPINYNFNRSEFLKFFDKEEIMDKSAGVFDYTVTLDHGFEFTLSILAVDNFVQVRVSHDPMGPGIANVGFKDITYIKLVRDAGDKSIHLELYKNALNEDETKSKSYYKAIWIKPYLEVQVLT